MRRRRKDQRGFSLLAVLLVLTVVFFVLATTVRYSSSGLEEQTSSRSRELIKATLDHGVALGLDELQRTDPSDFVGLGNRFDIFENWQSAENFVPGGPITYPPEGSPFAGELEVRVGLRTAQRTRAPAGEDARTAYGVIVELQVSARTNTESTDDAEERVSVGVRVPVSLSHSN